MLYHFWIRILSDRVPVCAATSFFRSPMVSSSLHFTLTFFPSRSFSTTSIIFARLNLNLRFPNPNYSLSHAFTNFLRNPLFDWKSTENFSPYIYIYWFFLSATELHHLNFHLYPWIVRYPLFRTRVLLSFGCSSRS